MSKFSVLVKNQYGFREGMSTEDALFELTANIYNALNDKKKHITIFLDLCKAFDTVSHDILLEKLELYGIRGHPLELFRSYIKDRRQCVRIKKTVSEFKITKYGIAQGTVMCPFLFLLYVNDMVHCGNECDMVMFADDTALLFRGDSWLEVKERAERVLVMFKGWLDCNQLTLNTRKTHFIAFSPVDKTRPNYESLVVHEGGCQAAHYDQMCQCERISITFKPSTLGS